MRIAERVFSYDDCKYGIVLRRNLITDDNWFGGRVYAFGRTKEGFLLCLEGELDEKGIQAGTSDVIGMYIPTLDGITQEGLELLRRGGIIPKENIPEVVEEIKETIEEDEVVEDVPQMDTVKVAEITAKVTEIVNKKLETRPRRPSHPAKGRKK